MTRPETRSELVSERTIQVRGHIRALDGLRGVAIVLVLFHHMWPFVWSTPGMTVVTRLHNVGWIGVDLFFVLSGFLISGILMDSRGRRGYWKNFFIRRSLRIFPLYFLYLAVVFTVLPVILAVGGIVDPVLADNRYTLPWFIVYASNYLHLFNDPVVQGTLGLSAIRGMESGLSELVVITWSLAVEEQFYLLWPAVVLLFAPALPRVVLLMCLAALASRIGFILYIEDWGHVTNMVTLCRMDALAIGALVAWYVRSPNFSERSWRRCTRVATRFVLPLTLAYVLLIGGRSDPLFAGVGYTLAAVGLAGLLALALERRRSLLRRILENRVLMVFGAYSYGLYLYHMLVWELLQYWRPASLLPDGSVADPSTYAPFFGSALLDAPMRLFLAVALTLAIAWASHRFFEMPFLRLKSRFSTTGTADGEETSRKQYVTQQEECVDSVHHSIAPAPVVGLQSLQTP